MLVALNLSHGVQAGRTPPPSTLTLAVVAVIIAAVANRKARVPSSLGKSL